MMTRSVLLSHVWRLRAARAFAVAVALACSITALPLMTAAQEGPGAAKSDRASGPAPTEAATKALKDKALKDEARKDKTVKDNAVKNEAVKSAEDQKAKDQKTEENKAQENKAETNAAHGAGVLALLPPDAVSEHTLTTPSRAIAYTATAGTFNLFGATGERTAAIFYTAYVAKGDGADTATADRANAKPERPLTFVFNGGPGAASAYLHLGLVGPKILDFGPSGRDGATARLIDNPHSWLAFTDLVVIDPIGTGWSRTAKPDDATNFYGVRQDAQAMAKTIALYVAHNQRSAAPKYLLGESYGGLRAVKTAEALRQDQSILVAGIVMVSPLLEGSLNFGARRFALGAALQLPSLAATELERRSAFSAEAIDDAEHFAMTDYLRTLSGPSLSGEAAQSFYARLAQLTGLPLDVVTRTRGFVGDAYIKHLHESEHAVVSRYDASITAPDAYPESASEHGPDPVFDGFTRAYGSAFASYARDELGFKTDMTYALLARDVNGKWDWNTGGGGGKGSRAQVSASDDLRELLSLTPSFRLLVAHGYSDLVTPYAVNKYVLEHLPPMLTQGRATLKLYRGGHMLYTIPASRLAVTADAHAFYGSENAESPAKE